MICFQEYKSPLGEMLIASHNDKLVICDWKYRKMRTSIDSKIKKHFKAEFKFKSSPAIENTVIELEKYFAGENIQWTTPIEMIGTEFQKSVWTTLQHIPYGKTSSYKALSETMNNLNAIRAIASANGANTLAIIIPCHRVIGSDGSLVGYAGGLTTKKKLLKLENSFFQPSLF